MSAPKSISGSIARGLVAGAIGTAAFDAWLYARYRLGGGESDFPDWESSAGLDGWQHAPAPALLGKRLVEAVTRQELAPSHARLVNNVMHWAYGIGNGVAYSLVVSRLARPRIRYGLPFGAAVCGSDYVTLPLLKLYKPIWEYDAKTLAGDFSAHLVYGLSTATALQAMSST